MENFFEKLKPILKRLADMRIAVASLAYSLFLTFIGTLAQVEHGLWNSLDNYFNSWFAKVDFEVLPFALYIPGAILLALVYTVNLSSALIVSIKWRWGKFGVLLIHTGIILLGIGQLYTQKRAEEGQLRISEGGYNHYSEDSRSAELAIIEHTDTAFDTVVAIPLSKLKKQHKLEVDELPFTVQAETFYRNAELYLKQEYPEGLIADKGQGLNIAVKEQPKATELNAIDVPAAGIKLARKNGSELGTWLTSLHPAVLDEEFQVEGRTFSMGIRITRRYLPFTVKLLDFTHEKHPRTEVPSNFASRIKLIDPEKQVNKFVDISMNEPLRYRGYTLFQASFADNDTTSILQVVKNAGWTIPYLSCALISLGMLLQLIVGVQRFWRSMKARKLNAVKDELLEEGNDRAKMESRSVLDWKKFIVPGVGILLALLFIGRSVKPMRYDHLDADLASFVKMPIQNDGRIKPLSTLARTSFISISGKQKMTLNNGREIDANEWAATVILNGVQADEMEVFRVDHPELKALFGLHVKQKFMSFAGVRKHSVEFTKQLQNAASQKKEDRSVYEKAVLKLWGKISLYNDLKNSIYPELERDKLAFFLLALSQSQNTEQQEALLNSYGKFSMELAERQKVGWLASDSGTWKTSGELMQKALIAPGNQKELAALAFMQMSWQMQGTDQFDAKTFSNHLATIKGDKVYKKVDFENKFENWKVFPTTQSIYILVMLLSLVGLFVWKSTLNGVAFWTMLVAFIWHTFGIWARVYITEKGPVVDLYSSAVFVGWASVFITLIVEKFIKTGIGNLVGAIIGFVTLMIAWSLGAGEDTHKPLRAVLDTNLWLWTHVTTITIGYATMFVAGILGIVYFILRGFASNVFDAKAQKIIYQVTYIVILLAALLSFVGTILGGIWADQSWGRFWGWDPKENGALMIVLWVAVCLHARLGGLVKEGGFMVLAIGGNIVTAFSWFGVNMLGVGLHSYGFMDSAFVWLWGFNASQLFIMIVAMVALVFWKLNALVIKNKLEDPEA